MTLHLRVWEMASVFLVFQFNQIALSHEGSSEGRGNHLHGSNFIELKNCDDRSKRKSEALIFLLTFFIKKKSELGLGLVPKYQRI